MIKKAALLLLSVFLFSMLAACAGKSGSADLKQTMESIKAQISMDEMMELTGDDLTPNYGIEPADVKQFAAIADTSGIRADEIVLIEGTDADAARRIKACLDARYDQKCTENKDYLPEQYAIIQKCSVRQDGNYVSMIISSNADPLVKIYEDSFQ